MPEGARTWMEVPDVLPSSTRYVFFFCDTERGTEKSTSITKTRVVGEELELELEGPWSLVMETLVIAAFGAAPTSNKATHHQPEPLRSTVEKKIGP